MLGTCSWEMGFNSDLFSGITPASPILVVNEMIPSFQITVDTPSSFVTFVENQGAACGGEY